MLSCTAPLLRGNSPYVIARLQAQARGMSQAAAATQSSPTTQAPAAPVPQTPSPEATAPALAPNAQFGVPKGRWHVSRTPSNQLPVYELAKRGGNYKLTQIKKVEGDKAAFKETLARDLGLDIKKVILKVPTGHVEVRGSVRKQVNEWLAAQGF
ncbi:mitochondrial large subunit ribosomal protein-domain-containing protein [Lasiosphaeris hirsuta]|uniref:Large ribosomal subunit protein mL49 n=1 Tax=Lasiosphaeris hirsuta TaxID=260670 RepID=A0AA40AYR4_9PEZI|nr:mitochondrial large subunit ribosomal protein-domain-containing protein [Lasiosphaeris hirsuta]